MVIGRKMEPGLRPTAGGNNMVKRNPHSGPGQPQCDVMSGYIWVPGFRKRDGTYVNGYCRRK